MTVTLDSKESTRERNPSGGADALSDDDAAVSMQEEGAQRARVDATERTSDEGLVTATLLGDAGAFGELVRRYRPALLRVCAQVAARAGVPGGLAERTAEDATQEAFIAAWVALDGLRDPSMFGAWLTRIARNKVRRLAGSVTAQVSRIPADELEQRTDSGTVPSPLEEVLEVEDGQQLHEALMELVEELRLPLMLHYFDGLPLSRIGSVLSLPVSTVKWRMFKGRQQLRQLLEGRNGPSKGGDDG